MSADESKVCQKQCKTAPDSCASQSLASSELQCTVGWDRPDGPDRAIASKGTSTLLLLWTVHTSDKTADGVALSFYEHD